MPQPGLGPIDQFRKWALVNRLGITKTVKSISWLSADNFATTLVSAIVGVAVARTLGPAAAGTWGYVYAVYSVALLLSALGMDQIVIIDLVAEPDKRQTKLATALGLRMISSTILAIALISTSIAYVAPTPHQSELLCLLALSLIAMTFDVVGNLFRAEMRFDRVVVPSIVSTLIGGAGKIFLVVHERSVLPLGFLTVGQSALMQGMIVYSAIRCGAGDIFGGFSFRYAKELLRSSLPLMVSGIAVFIYMRANIFFLDEYETKTAVGIYNAAAAISGIAYFIPNVLVTALAPGLYRLFRADQRQFKIRFGFLTSLLTLVLFVIALAVTLLAPQLIGVLYGAEFLPAAPVLSLHVWTLIPVAYGLTSSIWLAAEKRTAQLMSRTICGGIVNIVLNILLIPRFGIIGAAIATLIAMLTASMFMLIFFGKTGRLIFAIQLRSLLLIDIMAAVFGGRRFA